MQGTQRRRRPGFVEKTLAGISASIESAIFSEENARRPGFLQRRDPRAKLLAFALLIVATAISREWPALLAVALAANAAAWASKLDMDLFIKRAWFGIPLFSGVVIIPSIFFVGHTSLVDIPIGFATLHIYREGMAAAGIFILRVGASVTLAILLILTTPWADILKSLRFFRVPAIFILILAMTYRYIFLFLHTLNGMFMARKSRVVAHTSGREQRWWIVSSMGVLMSRSFRMSDEVYRAMLARGFNHQFRTVNDYRFSLADGAMMLVAGMGAAAIIGANWWLP
jgi:cobalt/nickel transport system permease protein